MAQDTRSRHLDQFMLRLPDGMRERLKIVAEANKRSMNAEIVARLEASFPSDATLEALKDASPRAVAIAEQIVARVIERVEKIRFEADDEIKALKEENRVLREAANSQSHGS